MLEGHPLGLDAFSDGRFIVQDEASQLIAELAQPQPGQRVLDLCASPGGKTVALSAATGAPGSIVACDVRPHRVRLLSRTLTRCRITNATVVHVAEHGPLPFRDAAFDVVLIDAPCSGLGTVRRDPDIRWRRTPEDLPRFAAAQRQLVEPRGRARPAGRPLVYSTCSSEPEENEEVVDAFLGERPDFTLERTHETLPFRDGLEAFYGAVLRRAARVVPLLCWWHCSEPASGTTARSCCSRAHWPAPFFSLRALPCAWRFAPARSRCRI